MTIRYLHAQPGATVLLACKICTFRKADFRYPFAIEAEMLIRSLPDLVGPGHFSLDVTLRFSNAFDDDVGMHEV